MHRGIILCCGLKNPVLKIAALLCLRGKRKQFCFRDFSETFRFPRATRADSHPPLDVCVNYKIDSALL